MQTLREASKDGEVIGRSVALKGQNDGNVACQRQCGAARREDRRMQVDRDQFGGDGSGTPPTESQRDAAVGLVRQSRERCAGCGEAGHQPRAFSSGREPLIMGRARVLDAVRRCDCRECLRQGDAQRGAKRGQAVREGADADRLAEGGQSQSQVADSDRR